MVPYTVVVGFFGYVPPSFRLNKIDVSYIPSRQNYWSFSHSSMLRQVLQIFGIVTLLQWRAAFPWMNHKSIFRFVRYFLIAPRLEGLDLINQSKWRGKWARASCLNQARCPQQSSFRAVPNLTKSQNATHFSMSALHVQYYDIEWLELAISYATNKAIALYLLFYTSSLVDIVMAAASFELPRMLHFVAFLRCNFYLYATLRPSPIQVRGQQRIPWLIPTPPKRRSHCRYWFVRPLIEKHSEIESKMNFREREMNLLW